MLPDRVRALRALFVPTREHWALVLALPAVAHLILLASIFVGRVAYPVDIEWMEGGVLTMASRMQQGLPVYASPGLGYAPFPYPFAYPLLLAALGTLLGQSYVLGRLVSIGCVMIAFVLLGREVGRAHRGQQYRWAFGLGAAGFAAAGFPVVDGWYDLVRVDSMAFGLVVVAAACVSAGPLTHRRLWTSASSLALAASTKQTVAPFVVAIVGYALWQHGRRGLAHAGAALGLFVAAFGAAELLSGGEYSFYVVTLMAGHRMDLPRVGEGLRILFEFAPYTPFVMVAAVALAWRKQLSPAAVLWGALALLGWGFGTTGMAKDGAHVNSLLPAVWFTPAFSLIVCGDAFAAYGATRAGAFARGLLPVLGGVGLLLLWYPSAPHRLSAERWKKAQALHEYVRSLPGRVHAPTTPFIAEHNGKGVEQLHAQALGDLSWAKFPYRERYETFLGRSDPDFVIASGRETGIELLYRRFQLIDELPANAYDVTTTVGWQVRPRWVLRRPRVLPRARVVFDFEAPLDGWTLENFRATARPPRGQGPFWGAHGKVLDSFHRRHGDRAVGEALSPPFRLDRPCLSLSVGGGASPDTRVQLEVGGERVHQASGLEHDALRSVDWDVGPYMGELARLRVIDQTRERWGFITLDDVVLSDGCGRR